MYACLLYLVLFIGSVQAATIGGAFSTVIDTILYLFKWVNTAIVLIFLWERRDWILRVMGQQPEHPPDRRVSMDNELLEQNARLIAELEQRVADLHSEAQARELAIKKKGDEILELKETIRLQERKQEQLKQTIAAYERIPQPDLTKTKQDVQTTVVEKEKQVEELREQRDNAKQQLQEYIDKSKRNMDDVETKNSLLIHALEIEIASLKEQLHNGREEITTQSHHASTNEAPQVDQNIGIDTGIEENNLLDKENTYTQSSVEQQEKEEEGLENTAGASGSNTNDLARSFGIDLSSLDMPNEELDLLNSLEGAQQLSFPGESPTKAFYGAIPLEVETTHLANLATSGSLDDNEETLQESINLDSIDPSYILNSSANTNMEAQKQPSSPTITADNFAFPPSRKGKGANTAHKSVFALFGDEGEKNSALPDIPQANMPVPVIADTTNAPKSLIKGYSSKADINKAGLKRSKKKSFGSSQPQMEDFHFCSYPFGDESKALFGVFDGHAGTEAASEAIVLMPNEFAKQVKSVGEVDDATEILRKTFALVDHAMLHCEYVGCTATLTYIWKATANRYIQVANLGDSAAFLCRGNTAVKLTVDHKASEPLEKQRMREAGIEIGDNQSRINGLAVSRSLGNHFVKEQNIGMIAEPYVHECIKIENTDQFVIIASDGLWDIVSGQRAVDIVLSLGPSCTSEEAASTLLKTALQSSKCNDNVTVVVVHLN